MFSFIELPLCASRHFFIIFLINAHLEEDVFIRKEALKKVHRLLTFLYFKVGAYFNLRFQMLETDVLNVIPPLSPSYEGRPAVYTGCVLCQICFTSIKHFKEAALHWKNCSYEYKRVHALVYWGKGEKIVHKACNWTFCKKSVLISKEKEAATVASVSNNTYENTIIENTTNIHSNIQYIQYPFGFECFV